MKKDFIVSKIEAFQDGSQYVLIGFTDPNEPKSSGGAERELHLVLVFDLIEHRMNLRLKINSKLHLLLKEIP
jgi:hypothetical protein